MAYTDEKNAGYRTTGFLFGATAILGRIRWVLNKIIGSEVIQADGNNYPVSRPVDTIDARLVLGFLDLTGSISESTAAANCTVNLTEAAGTSGSITVGKMVARSVDMTGARRMGGFLAEQTMELEGALTLTPSI